MFFLFLSNAVLRWSHDSHTMLKGHSRLNYWTRSRSMYLLNLAVPVETDIMLHAYCLINICILSFSWYASKTWNWRIFIMYNYVSHELIKTRFYSYTIIYTCTFETETHFLPLLGFELRSSCMQIQHSTNWAKGYPCSQS